MAMPRFRSRSGLPQPGRITNIGTTVPHPRAPTERPQRFLAPLRPRLPPGSVGAGSVEAHAVALPIAQTVEMVEAGEEVQRLVAQDPIWRSRWQPSATPVGQPRPWVTGFRWWVPIVRYTSWGPTPEDEYRIDFMWRGHRHAYYKIPRAVWIQFITWGGSVGQWFHANILVDGWNGRTVKGVRYPDFEL